MYRLLFSAVPEALVQTCIVHLVRYALRFYSWKDYKVVAADLRRICSAPAWRSSLGR